MTHSVKETRQQIERGREVGQNLKKGGGERVSNIGGIHKIGGLETLCQLRLKNGQTYFKNLGVFHTASFLDYVWLFFQDYEWKG